MVEILLCPLEVSDAAPEGEVTDGRTRVLLSEFKDELTDAALLEFKDADGLTKDIGPGELVILDNGVPRDAAITELPAKEQSRVLRKVDFRVVPLLTFLYLIAYIDRNNSASALSCSSVWFDC